mmetsp:Transcript_35981/g.57546  ORF Transcript_35981/g.57546 Transcript_35981/m.57546 type:complete len:123 (+) Transcript_35981:1908-2276(+)
MRINHLTSRFSPQSMANKMCEDKRTRMTTLIRMSFSRTSNIRNESIVSSEEFKLSRKLGWEIPSNTKSAGKTNWNTLGCQLHSLHPVQSSCARNPYHRHMCGQGGLGNKTYVTNGENNSKKV